MRFRRLYLKAVGPFTDVELDFSAGERGMHIVHGPNEAGKSSALSALSDLLFGFEKETSNDFIHNYRELRVGAAYAATMRDA